MDVIMIAQSETIDGVYSENPKNSTITECQA